MYTNKIYILDFYDSFTYNIASDLSQYFLNIEVIKFDIFIKERPDKNISCDSKMGIVFGPGPGNPNEYNEVLNLIKEFKEDPKVYIFGICLGHQLIAKYLGLEIVSAKLIKHGESEIIQYEGIDYQVQRYNSLAVKGDDFCRDKVELNGEIIILQDKNLFSMQFHPESVGTINGDIFYRPLISFFLTR